MKILDVTILPGLANLKALIVVEVYDIVFTGLRLLENNEGVPYLSEPCKKRGDKWESIYVLPIELKKSILEKVLIIKEFLNSKED